jgi:eukaryotic-like serine/threonine-protein kinase
MSATALEPHRHPGAGRRRDQPAVRLEELGELVPVGRPGGQGRVYRPLRVPPALGSAPVVVKLYRRPPPIATVGVLQEMIAWSRALRDEHRAQLHWIAAWPTALVWAPEGPVGIAMHDLSGRFEIPFLMPSGRRERVLLSLEHLLVSDDYLLLRGLPIRLDTTARTKVAERISGALAFLHRSGIAASDIAPNNVLIGWRGFEPTVCFIDCDSMVFHGRQALATVETADWQIPASFSEPPRTRAADAYKLGLVVLRLFARSHDARDPGTHLHRVPTELRSLLTRSLSADAANRPPAGEWQRALRETLARGRLNERFPGPRPKTLATRRPVAAVESAQRFRPRSQVPAASRAAMPPPVPRRGGHRPFSFALLAVVLVMLMLLLARFMSASVQSLGGAGAASGQTGGGARVTAPFQYYYVPSGPGTGYGVR